MVSDARLALLFCRFCSECHPHPKTPSFNSFCSTSNFFELVACMHRIVPPVNDSRVPACIFFPAATSCQQFADQHGCTLKGKASLRRAWSSLTAVSTPFPSAYDSDPAALSVDSSVASGSPFNWSRSATHHTQQIEMMDAQIDALARSFVIWRPSLLLPPLLEQRLLPVSALLTRPNSKQ